MSFPCVIPPSRQIAQLELYVFSPKAGILQLPLQQDM